MAGHVFISHSSRDDLIVGAIRNAFLAYGIDVWDDARQLTPGDQLAPEIQRALDESRAVVAVLSPRTINSNWVTKEIRHALELQRQRGPMYRVIPLMVDGIEAPALHLWFTEEPVGLKLQVGPGGIQNALPALLDGLGLSLPSDTEQLSAVEVSPITDLTLELSDPSIDRSDGKSRGAATAELIYRPAEAGAREVRSRRFKLVAPLGPIEAEELRWYLERYVSWPTGVFQERARSVEARLPEWGRQLHKVVLEHDRAREAYEAWKRSGNTAVRRLTVLVDQDLMGGIKTGEEEKREQQAEADEVAALLLGLPWELLHDDVSYLFHGPYPVRVRRRLPNRKAKPALLTAAPLRVLLVSPRPEDGQASYIDHRVSARPVVEALSSLGELAELRLLSPPTFKALAEELGRAQQQGKPYHVVHFDGHGVYSKRTGLGALCFERVEDSSKLEGRRSDIVDATKLAEVMRDRRVPLFFLAACQTAVAEKDPTASVAGTLLQGGVASVVAMSHSVLVETARRFVTVFYQELLAGRRIGDAMVAGQRELKAETFRYRTFQGDVHLEDWFVPVLYQEEDDPQLIRSVPSQRVEEVLAKQRSLSLGELPAAPEHGFVGRSRELLKAERLLGGQPYVVLRGQGGEGKTTVAAELARWLVATRRYEHAAFASLEKHGEARSVLSALGNQLVVGYESRAGQDAGRGWLEVERALRERRTLVVLDNMESVLPPEPGAAAATAFEPEVLQKVLELAANLTAIGGTRLVFTSRQAMPSPFANNHVSIGRLERREAIDLVARALGKEEQAPRADDPGESEDEVTRLVDAVGCHARSLVLVAREVAESGVQNATERLGELMAHLQERYPEDRERSLYASVELSLRRLPAGMREAIRPLGVFQGGGQLIAMASVLGLDLTKPQLMQGVTASLVRVGLGEQLEYGYFRLDPALGPLLCGEMSEAERSAARDRWGKAMAQVTHWLYQLQWGNNPRVSSELTVLDLPNLLGALEHLGSVGPAEVVVAVGARVENLLRNFGRPKALGRATRVREAAAKGLGEWNQAHFVSESQVAERLLEAGRFPEAITAARLTLKRARSAGETAHETAAYDLAMAQLGFGRALQMGGDAAAALAELHEARDRLQALADAGDRNARGMLSVAISESGDCLRDLGRLEEAASEYEKAIRQAEQLQEVRRVADIRVELGMVRIFQRRYGEALAAIGEAQRSFERLGDLRSLALSWHRIGIVYQEAKQYDEAEQAFQASLRIVVQTGHRSGEADTLGQLGILYEVMGHLKEAVRFHQQAATAYRELKDFAREGFACSNLANSLILVNRHEEARREVLRAIELKEPFGHAGQPWKTFATLAELERVTGNMAAASAARKRAIDTYLAYRRDGGESISPAAPIFGLVAQAVAGDGVLAAEAHLAQIAEAADVTAYAKSFLPKLRAILRGARDPSLAADPELDYDVAAELELLLEHISRSGEAYSPAG